jgi:methionyl-tRNA formyltransferase
VRVAFAGTPEFARVALDALLTAGFTVPLVLTQPDRPAGRGKRLQASPVKQLALSRGITVHQPERLRDPATHAPLIEANVDVLVVAAYGLILPQAVLDIPQQGCLNIHASLLPRWRGAAPIQRAIEAGDRETGITLMRMEAGLDTGPMLLAAATPIEATDTAASLHDRLALLGGTLVVDGLQRLSELVATPQAEAGVTYAHKIEKTEALIDWSLPADLLARRVRAFDPFPGMQMNCAGEPIKVWRAQTVVGGGEPGQILAVADCGIDVACGDGALRLLELQKPGGRRLAVADFLNGFALASGSRLA